MSEREKENQHRWLKMQAGQATIYVILETLIIETNREGSHPTSTKRVGRSVGGGQRGLLSASANLTGNAGHLNQQRRITSNVNKACGEKRGVRSEASVRQPPIKPEPVFFWANSGRREETNNHQAIQQHFSEHSLKNQIN